MPRLATPCVPLCLLTLAAALPAAAALDFHTYAINSRIEKVVKDGKAEDVKTTSYDLTRLGSSTLEASSLTITSHGSYLSVVEEATLSGNLESRPHDITKDFLLQGGLPIPPTAAVHALSVWHGDSLFAASLRKMVYSLDDRFLDTAALKQELDARVAFLQRLSDQEFEAAFTRLSLGEPVRVRIAYDLPMPGGPSAAVTVPVIFHPSGTPPRQAQITFFEAASGLPALQWMSESGRVTMEDKGTHTLVYRPSYVFRRDETKGAVASLQATGISAGRMRGEYLLFKGGLDDSLMNVLSRPMEVSFLWRWSPPFAFVGVENGLKTLSPLGRLAAAEARAMKRVIAAMGPRGHRFGLLHSIAGKEEVLFVPAAEGSDGQKRLLAYLDSFSEDRLFAEYKDYKFARPDWAATAWKDSGEVIGSRSEFLAALGSIRKGMGEGPGTLRHIEMLGLGGAHASLLDLNEPKEIEAVIDSVTMSHVFGAWLGVDLAASLRTKSNETLRPMEVDADLGFGPLTLWLPVFQPSSVEYRAFTATRSHAVVIPFSAASERQALIKAATPFSDSLQLQGIDALGRKTRIHSLRPRALRVPEDTGMVRLWAADPDRIAETGETDLGMRYGILTKGSYLAAGIMDGVLKPDGVVTSALPKAIRVTGGAVFRLEGGMLRLEGLARTRTAVRVEIFDIGGRKLGMLELEAFRSGDGYAVPLDRLARFGRKRLVLVLRGAGAAKPFTLFLGGRP